MGARYLIDSNAVIDYLMGKLPPEGMAFMDDVVNAIPKVSIITKMEVLGYHAPPADALLLMDFLSDSDIFGLSDATVQQTIDLRKSYKIKLPDAIIAATALVHGLGLISRNLEDFKNISGLTVINPHTP